MGRDRWGETATLKRRYREENAARQREGRLCSKEHLLARSRAEVSIFAPEDVFGGKQEERTTYDAEKKHEKVKVPAVF